MNTGIQLQDVQAHILRGAKPAAAFYLALNIIKVQQFLGFIDSLKPYLHSEERVRKSRKHEHSDDLPAPLLVNLGFSFTGLKKLGLHEQLLAQFPLPFQQGMAARAAFIGDAGNDAPERWQGRWGHPGIHVFVAFYYLPGQDSQVATRDRQESVRARLEHLLEALSVNEKMVPGALILEREYAEVIRKDNRIVEHFGFKDGISQPWVKDGIAGLRGGGKKNPGEDDWLPLAAGEFLLGYCNELKLITQKPDTTGNKKSVMPVGPDCLLPEPDAPDAKAFFNLTRNGTFLVYRKIEQDVKKFREDIVGKHGWPLAEQLVGRQVDGKPLLNAGDDSLLASDNDFDFSKDRDGMGCPYASHVRRTNPRTSLDASGQRGTRDVDQHRMIRRGMCYGPWLDDTDNATATQARGLHFLCYNANIESQFEFVQKNWINNSDFIGCPGTLIDPVVGSHIAPPKQDGNGQNDRPGQGGLFVAPARDLPVFDLPSVTTVKGGEYFFVPGLHGIDLIQALASAASEGVETITPDSSAVTDPFDAQRILGKAQLLRNITYTAMPVTLANGTSSVYHYFAHPLDVQQILQKPALFGNGNYQRRIRRLTGADMLLSMPPTQDRTQLKQEMQALLTPEGQDVAVKAAIAPTLLHTIRQFAQDGEIDLVEGLARKIPLAIVKNYLGVDAPDTSPSPTQIAHLYDREGIEDVPQDWRDDFEKYGLRNSPDDTLLFWARMLFLEVFGNLWNVSHISALALNAGSEFALHLQKAVENAFANPGNATVLQRLVGFYQEKQALTEAERKAQVQQRMLEFVVGSTDTTMKAIATTVSVLLQNTPNLETALQGILSTPEHQSKVPLVQAFLMGDQTKEPIVDAILDAIIIKILKVYPVAPLLVRDCAMGATLKLATGQSVDLAPGSTVCVVLQAASALTLMNPQMANLPEFVFLDPWSAHGCMGKSIALTEVREVLKALLALKNVRTAAGARGSMIEKYRLPAYQLLRCDGIRGR